MTLLDEIKTKCSAELLASQDADAIAAVAIKALAEQPDHVTEFDVRRAIWADDGSYLA